MTQDLVSGEARAGVAGCGPAGSPEGGARPARWTGGRGLRPALGCSRCLVGKANRSPPWDVMASTAREWGSKAGHGIWGVSGPHPHTEEAMEFPPSSRTHTWSASPASAAAPSHGHTHCAQDKPATRGQPEGLARAIRSLFPLGSRAQGASARCGCERGRLPADR